MHIHTIIPAIALSLGFALAPMSAHAADSYTVDPVHTAALFKVKHAGVSYTYGRFNDVSGIVVFDAANPAASIPSTRSVMRTWRIRTSSTRSNSRY